MEVDEINGQQNMMCGGEMGQAAKGRKYDGK